MVYLQPLIALNWFLKILFIGASGAIVYIMRFGAAQKASYNADQDSFPIQYLLGPCAVLGLLINQDHWSLFEIVWAFSIYLEAVAILPQLFLLQKQGEVENLTGRIAQWGFLEFCDPHPALIGAFGTAGPWAEHALMHVQMNTAMGEQTCR